MTTIADIAEAAGVSTGTVANVLKDRPVGDARRRRVLAEMKRLDYTPRPRRRSGTIKADRLLTRIKLIVVGHTFGSVSRHPIYMNLVHGVERACAERRVSCQLTALPDPESLDKFELHRGQGAVLFLGCSPAWAKRWDLSERCVVTALGRPLPGIDHADYDHPAVAKLACEYLRQRGVEQTYVVAPQDGDRARAFLEASEGFFPQAASSIHIQSIANTANADGGRLDRQLDLNGLEKGLQPIFAQADTPFGIFANSDEVAAHVRQIATRHGLVPDRDVHILGCNNDAILSTMVSASIDLHLERVGEAAVDLLHGRAAEPTMARRHLLVQPTLRT
ncbi:MAG: LacI family DNA-binding transcriptional regulator [Planctomycetota bacterium]